MEDQGEKYQETNNKNQIKSTKKFRKERHKKEGKKKSEKSKIIPQGWPAIAC
jgi:hypothetical protein